MSSPFEAQQSGNVSVLPFVLKESFFLIPCSDHFYYNPKKSRRLTRTCYKQTDSEEVKIHWWHSVDDRHIKGIAETPRQDSKGNREKQLSVVNGGLWSLTRTGQDVSDKLKT